MRSQCGGSSEAFSWVLFWASQSRDPSWGSRPRNMRCGGWCCNESLDCGFCFCEVLGSSRTEGKSQGSQVPGSCPEWRHGALPSPFSTPPLGEGSASRVGPGHSLARDPHPRTPKLPRAAQSILRGRAVEKMASEFCLLFPGHRTCSSFSTNCNRILLSGEGCSVASTSSLSD